MHYKFLAGNEQIKNTVPLQCDHKASFGSMESESEDMAMIGLDAMQRANSTLEDFVSNIVLAHEYLLIDKQNKLLRKGLKELFVIFKYSHASIVMFNNGRYYC